MCVEYLVANLTLLCSLKHVSLLCNILREHGISLFSSLFFYLLLLFYFGPFLSIFLIILLHNRCLFLQQTFERNQEHGAFIFIKPNKHIFAFFQCRSKTFWVDEKHVLRTSSVEAAYICGMYVILILGA